MTWVGSGSKYLGELINKLCRYVHNRRRIVVLIVEIFGILRVACLNPIF